MTNTTIKVSKTNATIKAILAATFPQYKGRKVKLVISASLPVAHVEGWDGGSMSEARLYNMRTGGAVFASTQVQIADAHWIVVEHSVFCGKDSGITIRMQSPLSADELSVAIDSYLQDSTSGKVASFAVFADMVQGCVSTQGSPDARDLHWVAIEALASVAIKNEAKAVYA